MSESAAAGASDNGTWLLSAALPVEQTPAVVTGDLGKESRERSRTARTWEPGQAAEATRRVSRNLGALLGGQAITWTVTLAWTVIVPRALGPAGLGILVSAQSVSGVLGIVLGMGTRNYLVREAVVNPADGPKLVGTALVLRVVTAPVVGAAAVVWARVAGDGPRASVVLYLITAMTVLTLITEPLQAAFQAIERMKYLAYADIINKTAQSLIGVGLVLAGFTVVGIAANMAIIAVLVLVLTFWWLRPHFAIDIRTNVARMGHMARQSIAYWAFGLFGLVYFWIDTIMLSLMTRPQVVGWYGVTSQLFQTLMFLPVLVQTAWLPRLVAAFTSGPRELAEAARAPVEMILVISIPIAVTVGLVADPLIHAVYGTGFAHAVPVMVILAFCVPPIYLNIILASVLLAAKRQRVWTIVMACAAVINPLMNLVLIPLTEHRDHNGAIGASLALVATEVLMDVVGFFFVGRNVFDRRMVRRCGLMCIASAGLAGAAYAARSLGTEISLAAGFATFGLLVPALGIVRREEFALARAELARVRRRERAPAEAPSTQPPARNMSRSAWGDARNASPPSSEALGARIEEQLAAQHLSDGVAVLYLVSWSAAGRSRAVRSGERERRRDELILGLLCDADGRPVAFEPLTVQPRGDRSLRSQIAKLKRRLDLSSVVVVAGGELLTKANVGQLSATTGVGWITSLASPMINKLARAGTLQTPASTGREIWEITGDGSPGERLIGWRDCSVSAARARSRDQLLCATESDLAVIAERVDSGALRGADRIWLAVGPVLNRHGVRKSFQVTITGETVTYARDDGRITAAEALDGVTVLQTSLTESTVPARRVVDLHRNLSRIEEALASLEGPDLECLPADQHAEDRARADALLGMLAYHLTWNLRPAG